MRTATLPTLAASIVLGAGAALAQQPSLDRSSEMLDTMTRQLKLCAEIQDTAARLGCYDRVGSGGTAPTQPPVPVIAPPPTAAGSPRPSPLPPPGGSPTVGSQPLGPVDPDRVGQDGKPVAPEDRAFDPRAQGSRGGPGTTIGAAPGVVLPGQGSGTPGTVMPAWRRIGAVPMRSVPGARVPVVTLELPGLRPSADFRWQLSMALANNTSRTFDVTIGCAFKNGDRVVSELTVILRNVRGGEKVAADVDGPPTHQFIDNAPCQVISPLQ